MEITIIFTVGILLAIAAGLPAMFLQRQLGRRLRMEKREQETRLRRIEEGSPDPMFTIDEQGCILSFNAAAEQTFGYRAKEIIGRSAGILIPAASSLTEPGRGVESLLAAQRTPNAMGVEITGQRKNGTYVPLHFHLTESTEHGRAVYHAVARDLSGRQEAARNARDVQFLDGILNSIGAGVLVVDRDGMVVKHNRAFEELTGYRGAESAGRHYWELLLAEEEWPRTQIAIADLISAGGEQKGEAAWRTRDGDTLAVYTAVSALRAGNLQPGSAVVVAFPLPGSAHEEFAGSMEAVERLAGGIAQQFNDLLTSINGYSELVLHTLHPEDPLRRDVEEIRKAGERATALTSQLLAFSRKQPMKATVVALNDLIHGMKPMLQMLLGDKIQISTILDLELMRVKADSGWIEQAILNLAVNARDAMPGGGKLTLETANASLDAPAARRLAQIPAGDYAVLTVSDTGRGMDTDTRRHMFEPFFTTKRSGRGMGMGLSTVYGVVRQLGGNVVVQSIPGSGTSVRLYLPAFAEAGEPEPARGLFLVRGAGAGSR
ncbi:MAG: Adaptive-response sensory-kinase SasA [Bryobacteraceae bacterium]|nr:Adaptive-response sensory-kinase SasA [Bryobacteraceae bacterium]